jgi:sensor histidine kinase YesM
MSARARRALLLLLGSTVAGLYFATQSYWNPALRSVVTWRYALTVNLAYYWVAGAAVPVIVALTRRWRFEAGAWKGALVAHVVAAVCLTAAVIVVTEVLLTWPLGVRYQALSETLTRAFLANFHSLLPTYAVVLAGTLAFDYSVKYRDRELRASQLEARLAEARLRALRMQLQPHFLFNTLNSISSLMYTDVEAADTMITRLGDFLRLTLESDGRAEVPLAEELEFALRYLDIEKTRFEDRLEVRVAVPDACRHALVPTLLLQPLVENAVRHGIDRRPEGGRLEIAALREAGRLCLSVANDGPAPAGVDVDESRSVGLANTRARLQALFGADHELRLERGPAGGAVATAVLPWRTGQA